jgi:PAS domain S-box-containing protein
MTQKRKIAIAYLAAVPGVLAVVLFQHTALFRVAKSEQSMAETAAVLRQCQDIADQLIAMDAGPRQAGEASRGGKNAFQNHVLQVRAALRHLDELTRNEPAEHSQFQSLAPVIERYGSGAVDSHTTLDNARILMSKMEAAQAIRLREEAEDGAWSVRLASNSVTYGGGLVIWLIGVAALLLFHDEKARTWTGVERRVHTRILETLPLSVCLTTHSGTILYANPAAEELFDHAPGDLVGTNVACLHVPGEEGDRRNVEEIFDGLLADQVWAGDLRVRKKDGSLLNTPSWIVNMGVAGKLYRVFIHEPPCRVLA